MAPFSLNLTTRRRVTLPQADRLIARARLGTDTWRRASLKRLVISMLAGLMALASVGCSAPNLEPAYIDRVKSIVADQEQSEVDVLDIHTEITKNAAAAKTPDWVTRHDAALLKVQDIAKRIEELNPPDHFRDANVVLVLLAQDDEAYVQAERDEFDPGADALTRLAATARATQDLSQLIAAETQARKAMEGLGVTFPPGPPFTPWILCEPRFRYFGGATEPL